MSILSVARMGNPVLREVAAPVPAEEILTPDFQRFCDDLLASMYEHDGVGLAAPQVRTSKRVVVLVVDEDQEPLFLVNPVLTPRSEEQATGYEGCLSLPGLRGKVARWVHIRVDALDRHGQRIAFEAYDWAARVVQHECDHLDGVLYIDRAEPRSMTFLDEFKRFGPPVPADDDEEEGEEGEEGRRGRSRPGCRSLAHETYQFGSLLYHEPYHRSGSGSVGAGPAPRLVTRVRGDQPRERASGPPWDTQQRVGPVRRSGHAGKRHFL